MIDYYLIFTGALSFAIIHSFSDALAYRVSIAFFSRQRKSIEYKFRYIFKGRSFCESCNTAVKFYYLIPVAGFLLTRGRCSACNAPVSWRFLVFELLASLYGAIAFTALIQSKTSFESIVFLLAGYGLVVFIASIDKKYFIIPTEAILLFFILGLVEMFYRRQFNLDDNLITLDLLGAFVWYLVFHLLRILSRYQLGLADVRLTLAMGFSLGYPYNMFLPTIAALAGLGMYLFKRIFADFEDKGLKTRVAFGVYLGVSFLVLKIFSIFSFDFFLPQ